MGQILKNLLHCYQTRTLRQNINGNLSQVVYFSSYTLPCLSIATCTGDISTIYINITLQYKYWAKHLNQKFKNEEEKKYQTRFLQYPQNILFKILSLPRILHKTCISVFCSIYSKPAAVVVFHFKKEEDITLIVYNTLYITPIKTN